MEIVEAKARGVWIEMKEAKTGCVWQSWKT